MILKGKHLIVIGVIFILVCTNAVIATLYMTRDVTITAGVSVVGAIQVYNTDGVTPLTSLAFGNWTGGVSSFFWKYFFVNNTGNQVIYARWNISSSSITWVNDTHSYLHYESTVNKYQLYITYQPLSPIVYWDPRESNSTALSIGVGNGKGFVLYLSYMGVPVTAESFSVTVTFYADSA